MAGAGADTPLLDAAGGGGGGGGLVPRALPPQRGTPRRDALTDAWHLVRHGRSGWQDDDLDYVDVPDADDDDVDFDDDDDDDVDFGGAFVDGGGGGGGSDSDDGGDSRASAAALRAARRAAAGAGPSEEAGLSPVHYVSDENLLQIFSHLAGSERDLGAAACVCKRWQALASDDSLWSPVLAREPPASLARDSLTQAELLALVDRQRLDEEAAAAHAAGLTVKGYRRAVAGGVSESSRPGAPERRRQRQAFLLRRRRRAERAERARLARRRLDIARFSAWLVVTLFVFVIAGVSVIFQVSFWDDLDVSILAVTLPGGIATAVVGGVAAVVQLRTGESNWVVPFFAALSGIAGTVVVLGVGLGFSSFQECLALSKMNRTEVRNNGLGPYPNESFISPLFRSGDEAGKLVAATEEISATLADGVRDYVFDLTLALTAPGARNWDPRIVEDGFNATVDPFNDHEVVVCMVPYVMRVGNTSHAVLWGVCPPITPQALLEFISGPSGVHEHLSTSQLCQATMEMLRADSSDDPPSDCLNSIARAEGAPMSHLATTDSALERLGPRWFRDGADDFNMPSPTKLATDYVEAALVTINQASWTPYHPHRHRPEILRSLAPRPLMAHWGVKASTFDGSLFGLGFLFAFVLAVLVGWIIVTISTIRIRWRRVEINSRS